YIALVPFTIKRHPSIGPDSTEEVVDNDSPIQSIVLGLKNLERVMEIMSNLNGNQRDDALLESLHRKSLEFWFKQMDHVLSMVGGYSVQYKNGSQQGLVYTPIPEKDQLLAVDFLLENAFDVPNWLSNPDYLARLYFAHEKDLLLYYQLKLLKDILDPARFKRLEFMEEIHGFQELQKNLISKLRKGLFSELNGMDNYMDNRRLSLQIGFIKELKSALQYEKDFDSLKDLAGVNRYRHRQLTLSYLISERTLLKIEISKILSTVNNPVYKSHLAICLDYLESVSSIKN
ncbi:MAG TPA: zinc-dependent metalloprotease, partial [Aquaticitalea sp.]|nr:zinc-dependent metalloprotease [Aquaticitalea sp.]